MSQQVEPVVVFSILEEKYCVAKLPPDSPIPPIVTSGAFFSVTCTDKEISVICEESLAPVAQAIERNWRLLRVQGPLEFALKGVLASLLRPLAEAKVGVFALSTYDTDYLLVQQYDLTKTLEALELAGHRLTPL